MRPRIIIGLMLGWLPAFFLYHFVNAMVSYIQSATFADWLAALPGLLVVLALALGPGLMVWIVIMGRDRFVLDLQGGRAIVEHDLRFHVRRRSTPIGNVRCVDLTRKTLRTRGHSSRTWAVQLILKDGNEPLMVGYEDAERDARELARRVSELVRCEEDPGRR